MVLFVALDESVWLLPQEFGAGQSPVDFNAPKYEYQRSGRRLQPSRVSHAIHNGPLIRLVACACSHEK